MPELLIRVPSYIGPSYFEESEDGWYGEWVQGITKADVEMAVEWAKIMGEEPDSILLEIGICDGGSTVEGFNIYNYLGGLLLPNGQKMPVRTRILALAASIAVPLALAADAGPEMDYTAQLMLHSATFNGGVYAETAIELRAQADRLDNTNQLLTDLLIARTGQTAEVVAGWMSKDTWLTATQAQAVGLCSKVIPLAPATTPVQADTLITARRRRATEVLARRQRLAPHASTAAAAAPLVMPDVKKPIGQAVKPTPRAAAKPAAKPAAQPKARKSFWQSLKEFAQQADEDEAEANADENDTTAATDAQSTELDNGAFLYHDGPLAQGSQVFNDEALTEATADGDYDTADGQVISVAAGAVTAIAASEDTAAQGSPADTSTASLAKRLDRLEASQKEDKATIATLTKERDEALALNKRLSGVKPPMPQARASKANADAPDAKNKRESQPAAADMGTL